MQLVLSAPPPYDCSLTRLQDILSRFSAVNPKAACLNYRMKFMQTIKFSRIQTTTCCKPQFTHFHSLVVFFPLFRIFREYYGINKLYFTRSLESLCFDNRSPDNSRLIDVPLYLSSNVDKEPNIGQTINVDNVLANVCFSSSLPKASETFTSEDESVSSGVSSRGSCACSTRRFRLR